MDLRVRMGGPRKPSATAGGAPEEGRRRYPLHTPVPLSQKLPRYIKIAGLESNLQERGCVVHVPTRLMAVFLLAAPGTGKGPLGSPVRARQVCEAVVHSATHLLRSVKNEASIFEGTRTRRNWFTNVSPDEVLPDLQKTVST